MSKFTDPIRDMRRCRHCGLDTILSEDIDDHEENCTENDLHTDAFDDWRDDADPEVFVSQ
jgi:hypothetical protein